MINKNSSMFFHITAVLCVLEDKLNPGFHTYLMIIAPWEQLLKAGTKFVSA